MQVVLYDNEEKRDHILDGVEQIINIAILITHTKP